MHAAVIVFPGSNRERDIGRALIKGGSRVSYVWHGEHELPAGTDIAVLPGGFSYGDYLRCGAIAARANIMDAVRAHAKKDGLVLGVCNGFQILCEAGLLPGVLMRNAQMRFTCRFQHLRVERNDTPFTGRYAHHQAVKVCVAHGEGNFVAEEKVLAEVEGEGRVAFRYCDESGALAPDANPNGTVNAIAGIYSRNLRVLGMMPHPENLIDPLVGGTDGLPLFQSLSSLAA